MSWKSDDRIVVHQARQHRNAQLRRYQRRLCNRLLADSTNEFLVPLALGSTTPEHLWLGMTWYYGGYQKLPMGRQLYEENLKRTGNGLHLGFLSAGH